MSLSSGFCSCHDWAQELGLEGGQGREVTGRRGAGGGALTPLTRAVTSHWCRLETPHPFLVFCVDLEV